jgi:hypothetical protein
MEIKESKLSDYQNRPAEEPKLPTESTVTDTVIPVTTDEISVPAAEQTAAEAVITTPAAVEETPVAEEVEFSCPRMKQQCPQQSQLAATRYVMERAIKTVDKAELYKELGLDPFVIELNEHLKNHGSAEDYLHR